MIRINLLAGERTVARRAITPGLDLQQRVTLACSLILVATALGVGWWYWSLVQQSKRLEDDLVNSQKEASRLRGLITQVQQFETRKAQLQERVGLIEELRQGQGGPVRLLDEISRSLPDMLWLTDIRQVGADLTINGRCTSPTVMADFVDNLKLGGYFKPVDIVDSQIEPAPAGSSTQVWKFSIKATSTVPGAAPGM